MYCGFICRQNNVASGTWTIIEHAVLKGTLKGYLIYIEVIHENYMSVSFMDT